MKAYEVIDRPEKWTTGVCARDKDGRGVVLPSDKAVSFCAVGALMRAYWPDYESYNTACAKLEACVGSATRWNDHAGWRTVCRTLQELDI